MPRKLTVQNVKTRALGAGSLFSRLLSGIGRAVCLTAGGRNTLAMGSESDPGEVTIKTAILVKQWPLVTQVESCRAFTALWRACEPDSRPDEEDSASRRAGAITVCLRGEESGMLCSADRPNFRLVNSHRA